jgi:hypothetical protein
VSPRQHALPDGSLHRFSISTLRAWLRSYQRGGLDALLPRAGGHKGTLRKLDDDIAEIIARHRIQRRKLSVKLYHEILHEDSVLPAASASARQPCAASSRPATSTGSSAARNKPAFGSRYLAETCARVGCALLRSEPFDSPSRGKIELFFRTVRLRFLPRLTDPDLASLDTMRERLEPRPL